MFVQPARADWPQNLGYWMGSRISRPYYEQADSKRQAIYDLLDMQDYAAILAKRAWLGGVGGRRRRLAREAAPRVGRGECHERGSGRAMKKIMLTYLASYLFLGGAGFALAPAFTLRLFLSNGDYGDIMPRVVGMFMMALGGLVWQFVRRRDFSYYPYSVYARTLMFAFLIFLYVRSADPLFLVILAIVLLGLAPSLYLLARERISRATSKEKAAGEA